MRNHVSSFLRMPGGTASDNVGDRNWGANGYPILDLPERVRAKEPVSLRSAALACEDLGRHERLRDVERMWYEERRAGHWGAVDWATGGVPISTYRASRAELVVRRARHDILGAPGAAE